MKSHFKIVRLLLVLTAALAASANANDWPQWRGPQRNSISQETGLLKEWPKEGPKMRWEVRDAGAGYSTPAVVADRLFLLGNEGMENEFVQARSVKDGKQLWRTTLGKVGPNPDQANYAAARSTPTVDGQFLYALASGGDLACLETATGKVRWKKNLGQDFAGTPGQWAYAESPLIDGDVLVCTPGGSNATMVALNKNTGGTIWKCVTPEADLAAFASAVVAEVGGIKQYVQLLQKGLVGVDAKTGKLLWRYDKPVSRFDANIPTPLVSGNYIYVASAGTGGGTVQLKVKDGTVQAEEVYFGSKFPASIGGAIKIGDFLYGTSAQAMSCIEFTTGQIKWEDRGQGAASLLYADGRLYAHGENGEVALIEPSPEAYREKGRFAPPNQPKRSGPMEKPWAYPVVANGQLYIRDHHMLWCYDVRAPRP